MRAMIVLLFVLFLVPRFANAGGTVRSSELTEALTAYDTAETQAAYAHAADLLRPHAEAGSVDAQYRLGRILVDARGAQSAVGAGLDWLSRAYNAGDAATHHKAGLAYATTVIKQGLRGPAATTADRILRDLVDCDMPAALTNYAVWTARQARLPTSRKRELLEEAALTGFPVAQYNLGLLEHKRGNPKLALSWLLLASTTGLAEAEDRILRARSMLSDAQWAEVERGKDGLSARISPRAHDQCG